MGKTDVFMVLAKQGAIVPQHISFCVLSRTVTSLVFYVGVTRQLWEGAWTTTRHPALQGNGEGGPSLLPKTKQHIDGSLWALGDFMHQLSSKLEEYLGNVGMHVYMRGIWESGSRCWDWSTLALRPPRQMHAEHL